MMVHFTAEYRQGVLYPAGPLDLSEGETVELALMQTGPIRDEVLERMQSVQSLDELFAIADALPVERYDVRAALNANRRETGERLLFSQSNARGES